MFTNIGLVLGSFVEFKLYSGNIKQTCDGLKT